MAPTFTYGELNQDLGTNTDNGLRNVANAAGNFVCDLYQNYAQATTGFGDPTGIGSALNAVYSSLCSPRGKLPSQPPTNPFNGGQCAGASYRVTTRTTKPDGTDFTTVWPSLVGPIKGVQIKQTPSGSWQYGVVSTSPNPLGGDVMNPEVSGNQRQALDGYKVEILSISRNGGLPDNCGDPAPTYPPIPIPTTEQNNNINVNVGAGAIINVPISYKPVTVNAGVSVNPQIQVDVGPFNVTFDSGGVSIEPNFNFNTDTTTPTGNNGNNGFPTNPQKEGNAPCDLSPILTRLSTIESKLNTIDLQLDDIEECTCPVAYTQLEVALGSGTGSVVSLPSNAIQVRLNLTSIPANAKTQKGSGTAPQQLFCGYYAWGDGVGLSERVPINTAVSSFEVPVWASSFCWNLYLGYSASVSCITLVPEKNNAELAVRQMKMKPS